MTRQASIDGQVFVCFESQVLHGAMIMMRLSRCLFGAASMIARFRHTNDWALKRKTRHKWTGGSGISPIPLLYLGRENTDLWDFHFSQNEQIHCFTLSKAIAFSSPKYNSWCCPYQQMHEKQRNLFVSVRDEPWEIPFWVRSMLLSGLWYSTLL